MGISTSTVFISFHHIFRKGYKLRNKISENPSFAKFEKFNSRKILGLAKFAKSSYRKN